MPGLPKTRSGALILAVFLAAVGLVVYAGVAGQLEVHAAITLTVFLTAIYMWTATPLDDSYVALGAALILVVTGVLSRNDFTSTLGTDVIWLLIGAFVIAAGVNATGLMTKFAAWVVLRARTPRQLVHLLTAALLISAYAVPATSGARRWHCRYSWPSERCSPNVVGWWSACRCCSPPRSCCRRWPHCWAPARIW